MSDTILIPAMARAVIGDHAIQGGEREVCGILLGPSPNEVKAVWRADNVDDEPVRHYTIDPKAIADAIAWGEGRGMDVVGFYHSHPRGPPHPSKTDEARATWVDAAYVIRCMAPDMLGAWRWTGSEFKRLDVIG